MENIEVIQFGLDTEHPRRFVEELLNMEPAFAEDVDFQATIDTIIDKCKDEPGFVYPYILTETALKCNTNSLEATHYLGVLEHDMSFFWATDTICVVAIGVIK